MDGLLRVILVITIICNGKSEEKVVTEVKAESVTPPSGSSERSRALVVTLGGSEEEMMTSSVTSLLLTHGYDVTAFVYGASQSVWPQGTEIVTIPLSDGDPLYTTATTTTTTTTTTSISSSSEGASHYITPSQPGGKLYTVTSTKGAAANQEPPPPPLPTTYDAIVTSSRRLACQSLLTNTSWTQRHTSRAKILVTPLHFHDICTLTFARQFDLPVVGLVTSRMGSWWSWYWLGVLPPLATTSVPPHQMSEHCGFLERLMNVMNLWRYISTHERDWVNQVMTSLPPGAIQPIGDLYGTVASVMVAWDWLTDADLPPASIVTSLAGSQWDREEEIAKDIITPVLRNRNGAIFCNLKIKEVWVGEAAQRAILRALAAMPYTVVWRGVEEAQEGVGEGNTTDSARKGSAHFVHKENPPMAALLAHPRHRLLISMCGESDVTFAILVGSPTLCIPVTPDQMMTSDKLRDLGLGLVVRASDVTTNQVRDVIRELTSNKRYRLRGRLLAEEFIDQPLSASDRVIHMMEKLMRRPWSFKRQQSKQQFSPLVMSNGDVIAGVLVAVTSLVGVAVYVIIVITRLYIQGQKKKEEVEKEEKKSK